MNNAIKSLRFLLLILFYFLLIAIQAQPLRSVMVNACAGSGSEGENEYIIMRNSNQYLRINGQSIEVRYGNSLPASTTYTDSFYSNGNASYVNALNTYLNGTCDFSFVNGTTSDSIPPNKYFIIMYGHPTDTVNFRNWCGNQIGNVYVLFSKDQSWSASGNFVNAPTSFRHFRTKIHGTTCDYRFNNGWSSNADGNYVCWIDTGQATSYLNYSNCTPSNTLSLPVTFTSVAIVERSAQYYLQWSTASEINNAGFHIEQGNNQNDWESIGYVQGSGNSFITKNYQFELPLLTDGAHYFRLRQEDFDGKTSYSMHVRYTPNNGQGHILHFPSKHQICFNNPEGAYVECHLLNSDGLVVKNQKGENEIGAMQYISTHSLPNGVYFAVMQTEHSTIRKKILILSNP